MPGKFVASTALNRIFDEDDGACRLEYGPIGQRDDHGPLTESITMNGTEHRHFVYKEKLVIDLKGSGVNVHIGWFIPTYLMKQYPQAIPQLKKALELQPDQPLVLNYLAYSWIEMGQHFDEALESGPGLGGPPHLFQHRGPVPEHAEVVWVAGKPGREKPLGKIRRARKEGSGPVEMEVAVADQEFRRNPIEFGDHATMRLKPLSIVRSRVLDIGLILSIESLTEENE